MVQGVTLAAKALISFFNPHRGQHSAAHPFAFISYKKILNHHKTIDYLKENVDRINFQVIKKMKVLKELSQLKLMFVELILESHALKNTIETNFKNSDEA